MLNLLTHCFDGRLPSDDDGGVASYAVFLRRDHVADCNHSHLGRSERGQTDTAVIASVLAAPAAQDALAAALSRFAAIVLDTPVGSLAVLTDGRDDIRPGDTLRNVVERDDPDFERRLQRSTRGAAAAAGTAAGVAVTQMSELRRTAERLEEALGSVLGSSPGERR